MRLCIRAVHFFCMQMTLLISNNESELQLLIDRVYIYIYFVEYGMKLSGSKMVCINREVNKRV